MNYTEAMQMRKQADGGIINDTIGSYLGTMAAAPTGIGLLSPLVGGIAGLAEGPAKAKDLEKMDKRPAYSYIPGVGAYRLMRKYLAAMETDHPRKMLLSELVGPATSAIAPALLGGALGGALGGQPGAAAGATLGGGLSLAATPIGNLIGMARRRRTDSERMAEDSKESMLQNLLVPGMAGYRAGRRALDAYDDEVKRNEWNEAEREVNAQISKQDKDDKKQKKEAALRLKYAEALQLRKQAGIYQNNPNYDATTGILAALADFPNTTGRAAKSVAKPLLDMAQEYQFKRDMMQRDRFYNGLTAGIGVGGLTTAGAYGLTGLVPKLKDNKLLRWLLAGTAGGVAGVQAGRLSADAAAQRPQEVDV